jgi:hypothetical protein
MRVNFAKLSALGKVLFIFIFLVLVIIIVLLAYQEVDKFLTFLYIILYLPYSYPYNDMFYGGVIGALLVALWNIMEYLVLPLLANFIISFLPKKS